eukprot:g5093.t1
MTRSVDKNSYLIVPSDVTLLENKCSIGRKSLGLLEFVGLATTFPMYHNSYSKLDAGEKKAVLTKDYDFQSANPEVEVCRARQLAVSREVKSHLGWWGGFLGFGGITFWSVRKYNWQAKAMCPLFMAYAGSWVGRFAGDVLTGRNAETYRDRYLANLPAKMYYSPPSEN